VTGATGFVGGWLTREIEQAGHQATPAPAASGLDIADAQAVDSLVASSHPDVIAHLAAVAFGPDAQSDPARAVSTNIGGTIAVVEAAIAHRVPLLAVSSSEVYRVGAGVTMPLTEAHPLGPRGIYGRTKAGAEGVVRSAVAERRLEAIIARPFNHTGPGQRASFAVPAFAGRITAAVRHGETSIRAGNVDAARDLGDVRDVVVAYRLLLEQLVRGLPADAPRVVNIASGRVATMREVIAQLAQLASATIEIEQDPALLRRDDPMFIAGSAEPLRVLTGWEPKISLEETLRDVLAANSTAQEGGAATVGGAHSSSRT